METIKFLAHGTNFNFYFTPTGVTLVFSEANFTGPNTHMRTNSPGTKDPVASDIVVSLSIHNANPSPTIKSLQSLPRRNNFLRGKNALQRRTHIPHYVKSK